MNRRTILFLLVLLAPYPAFADTAPLLSPGVNAACRQAIAAAERAHRIPTHLLAAIARVESGRKDQASGTFNPWPWTINMDGQGSFYDNKAQAVGAAVSMRPHVSRSIDVGCMQISLTNHPDAFPSMDQAFDSCSRRRTLGQGLWKCITPPRRTSDRSMVAGFTPRCLRSRNWPRQRSLIRSSIHGGRRLADR
jgi:hypothetical protein